MGRKAGQSKQTWFAGTARIFLNCWFFSFVGMQRCPRPAAVIFPSSRKFPLMLLLVLRWTMTNSGRVINSSCGSPQHRIVSIRSRIRETKS